MRPASNGIDNPGTGVPSLKRPTFFDGQRLAASDLSAVQAFHRELRWLHNRTLHTWGIALGLQVVGRRGERLVTVQPGYALDCAGRELILTETERLPVPAIAAAPNGGPAHYYLTISYADDEDLPVDETRAGICAEGGAVRRPERPRFRWQDPGDTDGRSRYRRGLDIVLATFQVQNCQLAKPASLAERRDARPAQQPYVAAGSTPPGATIWTFWSADGTDLGVQAVADTSAAGFAATPHYMAHVAGTRELSPPGSLESPSPGQLADGFATVRDASPTGFTLRVLMPRNLLVDKYELNPGSIFTPATLDDLQTRLGWHVVWLGVEG